MKAGRRLLQVLLRMALINPSGSLANADSPSPVNVWEKPFVITRWLSNTPKTWRSGG